MRTSRDALRVTLVTAAIAAMMTVGLVPAAHASSLLDGFAGNAEAEGGDGGDGGLGIGVGCVNVLASCEDVDAGTADGGDGGDALAVAGDGDDAVPVSTDDKPVKPAQVRPERRDVPDEEGVTRRPDEHPKTGPKPAPRGGQVRVVPTGGVQTGAGGAADQPAMPLPPVAVLGAALMAGALTIRRLSTER